MSQPLDCSQEEVQDAFDLVQTSLSPKQQELANVYGIRPGVVQDLCQDEARPIFEDRGGRLARFQEPLEVRTAAALGASSCCLNLSRTLAGHKKRSSWHPLQNKPDGKKPIWATGWTRDRIDALAPGKYTEQDYDEVSQAAAPTPRGRGAASRQAGGQPPGFRSGHGHAFHTFHTLHNPLLTLPRTPQMTQEDAKDVLRELERKKQDNSPPSKAQQIRLACLRFKGVMPDTAAAANTVIRQLVEDKGSTAIYIDKLRAQGVKLKRAGNGEYPSLPVVLATLEKKGVNIDYDKLFASF